MRKGASDLVLLQRLQAGRLADVPPVTIERHRVVRRLDVHAQLREELDMMAWWLANERKMAG